MKYYGIYKITNLLNGKMYIGQHTTENLDDNYMGSGIIIQRAVKKYGPENFRKEWLMFCEDADELNYMELVYVNDDWINRSDTYNLQTGGSQRTKVCEETRKKLANAGKGKTAWNKGLPWSVEARQKMSKSHTNKKRSIESCKKQSRSLMGHSTSEETKQKIRQKNFCKPVIQYTLNGEFVAKFPSIQAARKQTHCYNVKACCDGEISHDTKFIFKYFEEKENDRT